TVPVTEASTGTVTFIAPDNNSTIAQGSTIQFAVSIKGDSLDGAKVDFLVDGTTIGSQTATTQTDATEAVQSSVTVAYSWTPKEVRGYLVSAQVSRPDGSRLGAADLTIQVVSVATTPTQSTPTLVKTPAPLPSFTPTRAVPTVTSTRAPSLA